MIATRNPADFELGSLVRARGREWVVLPSEDPAVLQLRPLGGTDADACGVMPALEHVEQATFALPDVNDLGDSTSALLLRDAIRLNFRAGAGPFRSFGRIAVEPRAYQLVPLLMALQLDPIRLLIADDVGIGKTVEAGLIAREMLDRGEIDRISVICPPHLCEQWQQELRNKFHIDAEVVRPGTVSKLERGIGNRSIFEAYPFTVVSVDYIKADNRRDDFVRVCPDFVIVDEAHTCAAASGRAGRSQQQRHQLLRDLVNPETEHGRQRHLIMATATPHSGVEDAFRSLLELLDPVFAQLPDDPTEIKADHPLRQRLANHLVQRRRADIRVFLDDTTTFPTREVLEEPYTMSKGSSEFFERARTYATDMIQKAAGLSEVRQRVSWWAALALMQAVTSSPRAAATALQKKANTLAVLDQDHVTRELVDELGKYAVLDVDDSDSEEPNDIVPGADTIDDSAPNANERRRLRELAAEAEKLEGANDAKLQRLTSLLKELLDDGFRPIVYCRYISTAHYLKEHLSTKLRGTTVDSVTGDLPAEDRVDRVNALGESERRVLVATDCLSEGINLQEHFDSVIHYDLAWNPTRHEQREGRVDRFGQSASIVRTVMLYGRDNPIDLSVMDVLLRKAERIRKSLGVTVSVPQGTGAVMNAIYDAIFHGRGRARQLTLGMSSTDADARLMSVEQELEREWKRFEEKASRTIFRQERIRPQDVRRELEETVASLGDHRDVERLVQRTVSRLSATLAKQNGHYLLPVPSLPRQVREMIPTDKPMRVGFDLPLPEGVVHLSRTHPIIEALASYLVDGALERQANNPARRASVIRTRDVDERTTIALLRLRMHLATVDRSRRTRTLLAEEAVTIGWRGSGESRVWLEDDEIRAVLEATPSGNLSPDMQGNMLQRAIEEFQEVTPDIERIAEGRADDVLAAHVRVREATRASARRLDAEAILPADVLGVFVYLPVPRL